MVAWTPWKKHNQHSSWSPVYPRVTFCQSRKSIPFCVEVNGECFPELLRSELLKEKETDLLQELGTTLLFLSVSAVFSFVSWNFALKSEEGIFSFVTS